MTPKTPVLLTRITLAALLTAAAPAQSSDRLPVTGLKPLLKLALEHGTARGVLTGTPAAYLQQRFGATAALDIDVRTLHPLARPGCSRLEVTSRQNGIQEKDHRDDKTLTYQLNYCRDGGVPGPQ